jgi:hypothetical protein
MRVVVRPSPNVILGEVLLGYSQKLRVQSRGPSIWRLSLYSHLLRECPADKLRAWPLAVRNSVGRPTAERCGHNSSRRTKVLEAFGNLPHRWPPNQWQRLLRAGYAGSLSFCFSRVYTAFNSATRSGAKSRFGVKRYGWQMSWDVLLLATHEPPPPVAEMPKSWRGEPLGTLADVREKIDNCIVGVDWSDPTWGMFDGDGYSYEFNTGTEEPCDSVMIHVRGDGSAVEPLLILGQRYNWYLLDTSQGEWLHHCNSAEAGWEDFQAFRDRVIQHVSGNSTTTAKKPWWRFW